MPCSNNPCLHENNLQSPAVIFFHIIQFKKIFCFSRSPEAFYGVFTALINLAAKMKYLVIHAESQEQEEYPQNYNRYSENNSLPKHRIHFGPFFCFCCKKAIPFCKFPKVMLQFSLKYSRPRFSYSSNVILPSIIENT